MSISTNASDQVPLVLPDGAPEFLVDGFYSASIANGIARLNMFSVRSSADGSGGNPTLVCRIALSLPSLIGLQQSLNQLIGKLQNDGVLSAEVVENGD